MKNGETLQASDWRDGFLFVGNHLALDFLNTCPIQNGQKTELLTDFNAVLRWFHAAEKLTAHQVREMNHRRSGSVPGQDLIRALHDLREKLRKAILAWEETGNLHRDMIGELNQLMAHHPMLSRLRAEHGEMKTETWFEANHPENLFAPLAHSIADLFANADHARVRKCGNCVLHFYDTSKKGTRRWCSMQLCGNRIKVAAYAARRRSSAKSRSRS